MSDFLFSTQPLSPGVLRAALERYLAPVSAGIDELHGSWGSLAVARAAHDGHPLFVTDGALSVLAGTMLVRRPGAAAARLDASNRAIVHQLLSDWAIAPDEYLDGPFAALYIDTSTGAGFIATDLFAWVTVFAASASPRERAHTTGARHAPRGSVIGTHVDAVADVAGVRHSLDPVSMADLVANFTITWPHTVYADVTQLPPASVQEFGAGSSAAPRAYWEPRERIDYPSPADAAAALRDALVGDVAAACTGLSEVGLLLSGGEDSRALLGAVPPGVHVRSFTYAPSHNREVRTARRVARAYGVEHVHATRDERHDLRHFETVAAMIGTQHEFIDVHGYGLHQSLRLDTLPLVLEGFSSDALLKADNVPPRLQRSARRGRGSARPVIVRPVTGVRAELLNEVRDRREHHRALLLTLRPGSADEWRFIWPYSMRKYAANVHGNRRLFRVHEPFMSNAVVRLAAAVPQSWKFDRRLFTDAVRPLFAPAWYVPHTRNRMPYFGNAANALLRPLLGAARHTRALLTGTLRANQESWPIWSHLVRSDQMHHMLSQYPVADSPLRMIFDDVHSASVRVREWTPLRQLVALQLAFLTTRA